MKELDFLEDDLKVLRGTGFCLVNAKLIQQFEEKLQPKSHSVKSTASIRKDKMTTTWTTISGANCSTSQRYGKNEDF